MRVLHLISCPGQFGLAAELASGGDVMVLMDEAVVCSLNISIPVGVDVHAMAPDLALRGLTDQRLAAGVSVIDYQWLVQLVERLPLIQSW